LETFETVCAGARTHTHTNTKTM